VADSRASSGYNTPCHIADMDVRHNVDLSNLDCSNLDFSKEPFIEEERKKKGGLRGRKTRRAAFQDKMEAIQTQLGNSDVRIASFSEPSRRYVQNERMSMFGTRDSDYLTEHFGEDFQQENLLDKVRGTSVDDGFSTIIADDYVRFRLFPAIANLSKIARKHGGSIFWLETFRYLGTMICAMCAVLQIYMMIPIMVAFISLITSTLEFHQFSTRLQSVNLALTHLQNLVIWWESLSLRKQRSTEIMEHLVEVTEESLNADLLVARKSHPKPELQEEFKVDDTDKCGESGSETEA